MASRRERCRWCNVYLVVPAEAQSFTCPRCQNITQVPFPHYNPFSHARESVNHAANQVAGLINMVTTHISTKTSSVNSQHGAGNYCSHQPPRPSLPLPSVHGRKRAVICGLNYRGRSYKVKGSINDANCMRYLLVEKFGFPSTCVVMLTEDETNPLRIPTKANMRLALKWLVQGCEPGDSLVFHFSGHGSRQRDYNMDEIDGFDEALCPLDFETEGSIVNDEINDTIVRPLTSGVTLHAIIDACYSETVLDLPFICRMDRKGYYTWEDQRCSRAYKGTSGGLAISFSACNDDQISMDTTALAGNASTGALTFSFIQSVQNEPGLSYGRLLNAMRGAIRGVKASGLRLNGPIASLVNKALFNTEIDQEPQLSSSSKFDVYSKQFML
ncbi:hypothetical protein K2173_020321 [Erythroxylum novogranatense]|uniref:Peptidase C14 caspase domain-containing protein n=1 Tax=Erythroxylum novogranatense TaxID=1862640 RepID=A0AAV8U7N7_9ROSI|nr:hypothetical protein K2173_020321 [Erythroxylum novogranatense]